MNIGSRITELRGSQSQANFGKKLGVAQSTIRNYELVKRFPDSEFISKLCTKFSVTADWLLFGTEPKYIDKKISEETDKKLPTSAVSDSKNTQAIEITNSKKEESADVGTFKERIKKLRGDMTLRAFAKKTGISVGALSNYENGITTPNINTIVQISERMGVSENWFLYGESEKISEDTNKELATSPLLDKNKTQATEITDSRKEESGNVATLEERIRILEEESKEIQKQLIKQLEDHNKLLEKYAALLKEHGELGVEMERLKAALAHKSAINGEVDGHAAGYVREPSVDKAG